MKKANPLRYPLIKAIAAAFFAMVLYVQPILETVSVLDGRDIQVTLTEITEELQEKEITKDISDAEIQGVSIMALVFQELQLAWQSQDVFQFSDLSFSLNILNPPPELLA